MFKKNKKKKWEIALGAAFISCINETIQSVKNNSHTSCTESLNKNVTVKTKGCQLRANDLDIMNTAAKIALNKAIDTISKNDITLKNRIINELWPTTNNIEVSFSLTPENKFMWSLDLD